MHRHFIVLLVALIASACGPGSSEVSVDDSAVVLDDTVSQNVDVGTPVAENEDIAAFFARFKSTVRANDAEAVANMAEFPFELGGMTREQFLDDYYASTFGEGDFRERLLAGHHRVDPGRGARCAHHVANNRRGGHRPAAR